MKKVFIALICFALFSSNSIWANEKKDMQKLNAQRLEYLNLDFWKNFHDENLTDNLMQVYNNNHDLKAVNYKVNEAQRLVRISFANELPHIGFTGYVGEIFNGSNQYFGEHTLIPDYTEAHFLLPLSLNYEVDIWGKNHLKTKAKKKEYGMVEQEERASYIYLTSAFACDYFNLIKADELIKYQKQLIENQKQIVKAVQKKYEGGTLTIEAVVMEEKALTYLQEDLQSLLEKQDTLENQLKVLLSATNNSDIIRSNYDKLNTHLPIPTAVNISILDKRPDRVKSELELEKIGYDVRVAKREMLPKFIINGELGFNFYSIASSKPFLANLGVVPTWDLFMGGRKIQILKMQKDAFKVATEHYEKTILTAMQETNDALYLVKTTKNKSDILSDRLKTDEQQMDYVLTKFQYGIADDLDILLKKQNLLISQKQVVSNNINELISAINLYQAVGGANYFNINKDGQVL